MGLPKRPADLHNTFYRRRAQITDGRFTDTWWQQTLRDLHAWIATRNARHADLTERFRHHRADLHHTWASAIAPNIAGDITTVTWEQVRLIRIGLTTGSTLSSGPAKRQAAQRAGPASHG